MTWFLQFTNIYCCCTGWRYVCLFPFCGWFWWPSSGVVGFYDHELSWCCSPSQLCLVAICWLLAWHGLTLVLLMTDVPDLAWVAVVAPMVTQTTYHFLLAVISMAQTLYSWPYYIIKISHQEVKCSTMWTKLILLTACKKSHKTMSQWYRTVHIPWFVTFYDTLKGKCWLNSNPKAVFSFSSFFPCICIVGLWSLSWSYVNHSLLAF